MAFESKYDGQVGATLPKPTCFKGTGVLLQPSVLASAHKQSNPGNRPRQAARSCVHPLPGGGSASNTSLSSLTGSTSSIVDDVASPVLHVGIGMSPFATAEAQHSRCGTPFGTPVPQPSWHMQHGASTASTMQPPSSSGVSVADAVVQSAPPQRFLSPQGSPSLGGFVPQQQFGVFTTAAPSTSPVPAVFLPQLSVGSMLAPPSSLPQQQQCQAQPEVQQLMLVGLSAAPSVLPVTSEGLQMQTADSLSNALLLSQLQRQTPASMAFAGCSSSMGLHFTEAVVPDQGPLLVGNDLLQLQLQLQLSQVSLGSSLPIGTAVSMAPAAGVYSCGSPGQDGCYVQDQLAAMDAALDAQMQALLALRSEINMRRSLSAHMPPVGASLAEMAVCANIANGLF